MNLEFQKENWRLNMKVKAIINCRLETEIETCEDLELLKERIDMGRLEDLLKYDNQDSELLIVSYLLEK